MSYGSSEFDPNAYSPRRDARSKQKVRRRIPGIVKALIFVIVLVLALVGFSVGVQLTQKSFEGCMISDKGIRDGKMLVFSENCGTMKVDLNPLVGPPSKKEVYDSI